MTREYETINVSVPSEWVIRISEGVVYVGPAGSSDLKTLHHEKELLTDSFIDHPPALLKRLRHEILRVRPPEDDEYRAPSLDAKLGRFEISPDNTKARMVSVGTGAVMIAWASLEELSTLGGAERAALHEWFNVKGVSPGLEVGELVLKPNKEGDFTLEHGALKLIVSPRISSWTWHITDTELCINTYPPTNFCTAQEAANALGAYFAERIETFRLAASAEVPQPPLLRVHANGKTVTLQWNEDLLGYAHTSVQTTMLIKRYYGWNETVGWSWAITDVKTSRTVSSGDHYASTAVKAAEDLGKYLHDGSFELAAHHLRDSESWKIVCK